MTSLFAHLLSALALFPASCGVTYADGAPHVTTHTSAGWHVTACVFTKPGRTQTGFSDVGYRPPPPPSCAIPPVNGFHGKPRR